MCCSTARDQKKVRKEKQKWHCAKETAEKQLRFLEGLEEQIKEAVKHYAKAGQEMRERLCRAETWRETWPYDYVTQMKEMYWSSLQWTSIISYWKAFIFRRCFAHAGKMKKSPHDQEIIRGSDAVLAFRHQLSEFCPWQRDHFNQGFLIVIIHLSMVNTKKR